MLVSEGEAGCEGKQRHRGMKKTGDKQNEG